MKKYIDAEGVMRACYDSFLKTGNKAYREIFALVEAVPAADVQEVRHGRWNELPYSHECSVCGIIRPKEMTGKWHYCPHCGAHMIEEETK